MLFTFLLALAFSAKYPVNIIPEPNDLTVLDNQYWTLQSGMQIGYDSSVDGAKDLANFISDSFYAPTGIRLSVVNSQPKLGIYLGGDSTSDEYHLSMDENLVTILAKDRELLFDGFQTLLQIMPYQIFSNKTISGIEWKAPCVVVHDKPRFQWRGLMVDVCRHFFGVDVLKTIINGMSHYKLNTLHFHLTEDQGWRIEFEKFPNLTKYGAIRDASPKHHDSGHLDGIPYGPYYFTIDEINEIIDYAAERSVKIVPEIEMPGHALAALSGYPQYSCTGGPFKPRCYWGVEQDIYCAGNDDTIAFLESLLDETLKIFDNVFIHCGGDECPRTRWETCPKCQQRIKDQGLANAAQLQCWFTQHFANYLESKGRRLIGWDEILDGGLEFPQSAVVMSWRGTSGGIKAASLGHDVVMTPTSAVYFDYWQFAAAEPYEYICCLVTSHLIYTYNPTDGIEEQYKHHVIGVQGNLWSEYIWEREDLEWKAFPRCLALAEVGWCPNEQKNWQYFLHKFATNAVHQLTTMGINQADEQYGTKGTWVPGDIPANKYATVSLPLDDSLNQKGKIEVAFVSTGGHDLHVKNVKLVYSGTVVATDEHESVITEKPTNGIYSFTTTVKPTDGKISLSAEMMCKDSDDCQGTVYLYCVQMQEPMNNYDPRYKQ